MLGEKKNSQEIVFPERKKSRKDQIAKDIKPLGLNQDDHILRPGPLKLVRELSPPIRDDYEHMKRIGGNEVPMEKIDTNKRPIQLSNIVKFEESELLNSEIQNSSSSEDNDDDEEEEEEKEEKYDAVQSVNINSIANYPINKNKRSSILGSKNIPVQGKNIFLPNHTYSHTKHKERTSILHVSMDRFKANRVGQLLSHSYQLIGHLGEGIYIYIYMISLFTS